MRVLLFGVSGMLGHAVYKVLAEGYVDVVGCARSPVEVATASAARIIVGVDVLNPDDLHRAFDEVRPDVVINAVGLVKQLSAARDPLSAIPINALLPHRLARLCSLAGARLVHVSTDCVFAGTRGGYTEDDFADATDLYGLSKRLGEVTGPGALTLRTSIVGRELRGRHGLVEWFLHATGEVQGFSKAIFSGVTTRELARVLRDVVLPRPDLSGLYHLSADAISKFDLLCLLNEAYELGNTVLPSEQLVIDRSLNSGRFREATGYAPPSWRAMIDDMRTGQDRSRR